MNISNYRSKRITKYVLIGTITWGIFILPVLSRAIFGEDLPLSGLIIVSIVASFLFTVVPIYWEFPNPPEGKEYYILFYPIFAIPVIILGIKIKELLY